MSKIKIPTETWVELYSELSGYVEEYSRVVECEGVDEPFYDDNGQRTPESDDKFCNIVDAVESILEQFFIREEL
tara:strand:+ start:266 stop:487 length:222 start_codon:yes stop_codon:yes gene_type:complete